MIKNLFNIEEFFQLMQNIVFAPVLHANDSSDQKINLKLLINQINFLKIWLNENQRCFSNILTDCFTAHGCSKKPINKAVANLIVKLYSKAINDFHTGLANKNAMTLKFSELLLVWLDIQENYYQKLIKTKTYQQLLQNYINNILDKLMKHYEF